MTLAELLNCWIPLLGDALAFILLSSFASSFPSLPLSLSLSLWSSSVSLCRRPATRASHLTVWCLSLIFFIFCFFYIWRYFNTTFKPSMSISFVPLSVFRFSSFRFPIFSKKIKNRKEKRRGQRKKFWEKTKKRRSWSRSGLCFRSYANERTRTKTNEVESENAEDLLTFGRRTVQHGCENWWWVKGLLQD